jgi:uracil-DNA glycosylase family 4
VPQLHAVPQTKLYKQIKACQQCALSKTRLNVVYGRGNPMTPLWLVGEAPGKDEDIQGLAFVERAGRMLDLCLSKEHIDAWFITDVVKCRPPENRNPTDVELTACTSWLRKQVAKYTPRVIMAMGRFSIGHFLGLTYSETMRMVVGRVVGHVQPCAWNPDIGIMPTHHPKYLLRNALETKAFLRQLARAQKLCDTLVQPPR